MESKYLFPIITYDYSTNTEMAHSSNANNIQSASETKISDIVKVMLTFLSRRYYLCRLDYHDTVETYV